MAVGYHKLNSSAARSKRHPSGSGPASTEFKVTPRGVRIWSPMYGFGITGGEFVSSIDLVPCEFESGYVVPFKGGAVRRMMDDFVIQNEKR
jgi:hypothetical protein